MSSSPARLENPHPGTILLEDYLKPAEITLYRLAKEIDVPWTRLDAIAKGKRSISADTAHRLARFFGSSPRWWLNLQAAYDLEEALSLDLKADLERITPWDRDDAPAPASA